LSASSSFSNDYIYLKEKGLYDRGQNELTLRLFFSNYHRSAVRDIYPRWAQTFDLDYSYYPFDKDIYGDIFTARTSLYFPGILKNNSLRLRFETESQNPGKFILGNRASFPRSYTNITSKKHDFYSADYFMPLVYPDFNISSFFYLTRIRTNFFYDFAKGTGNYVLSSGGQGGTMDYHDFTETFRSFGLQLMSDFYLFRMPFMISGGIEAAWRNPADTPYLKAVFNVDLFGMSIVRSRSDFRW
jgi:hypothetical protein